MNYKNELVDVDTPQQNEVQDSTQQNTELSYDAPRYHMTGGWTNGEYYIMINGSSDIEGSAKYILQKIPKKGKEKVVKHLQLTESTGNKLTAKPPGAARRMYIYGKMWSDVQLLYFTMPS